MLWLRTLAVWSFVAGCTQTNSPDAAPPAPTAVRADPTGAPPSGTAAPPAAATPPAQPVASSSRCESDADCVPASCCHPSTCVSRDQAPDCKDTMCTEECRGGTLDCGGSCACQNGVCEARLNDM